jgi:hypothetical protein
MQNASAPGRTFSDSASSWVRTWNERANSRRAWTALSRSRGPEARVDGAHAGRHIGAGQGMPSRWMILARTLSGMSAQDLHRQLIGRQNRLWRCVVVGSPSRREANGGCRRRLCSGPRQEAPFARRVLQLCSWWSAWRCSPRAWLCRSNSLSEDSSAPSLVIVSWSRLCHTQTAPRNELVHLIVFSADTFWSPGAPGGGLLEC